MAAKHFFYFLFFIFYITSCRTTKPVLQQQQVVQAVPPQNSIIQNLPTTLPALVSDSSLSNAHIGIYIYEPATKKIVEEYQSNKYFIPASNTKIATCYAAMKYLGDSLLGLVYDTLNTFGKDDSSIQLLGTADPTFLHSSFKNQKVFDFLNTIKRQKIYLGEIKNPYLSNPIPYGKGWAWDDYNESFMTEKSYFPIYGNVAKFHLIDTSVIVEPSYFQKKVFQSYGKISSFTIEKFKNENSFFVRDNNKKKVAQVEVPLKLGYDFETTNFNTVEGNLLADTLKKEIKPSRNTYPNKSFLSSKNKIYSQPTDSLLKPMMYNSDNFFAEQTLLMVSLNQLGYMSDEQIIDTLLKRDFNELPQKPRWVDGSGLSRYNLFTPQDFVFILNKMKSEFSWNRISTIFPSGDKGTIKGYYKNCSDKIFAKTGSVSNNFSISGFLKTNTGKDLIFSVMINNFNNVSGASVRLAIEKYLSKIISSY